MQHLVNIKLLNFMSVELKYCLDYSCYTSGQIIQSVEYRLHDPKVVGTIKCIFPLDTSEIIILFMVPIVDDHMISYLKVLHLI